MDEITENIKALSALLALQSTVEAFADLCEASEKATAEIRAFVKPYEDKVLKNVEALETVFGKDFMDVRP